MSVSKIYKTVIRNNFSKIEGNFPPDRQLALGDFGIYDGDEFQNLGNISRFGVLFKGKKPTSRSSNSFASAKGVRVTNNAAGSVIGGTVHANANISLGFSKKNVMYFFSAKTQFIELEDFLSVEEQLKKLATWREEYAVVTRILQGKNAIIAVSNSSGAEATIEANTPGVPQIDLYNTKLKFEFSMLNGISYKLAFNGNCQIGFMTSRLSDKRSFWQPISLGPVTINVGRYRKGGTTRFFGQKLSNPGDFDHYIFAKYVRPKFGIAGKRKIYQSPSKPKVNPFEEQEKERLNQGGRRDRTPQITASKGRNQKNY